MKYKFTPFQREALEHRAESYCTVEVLVCELENTPEWAERFAADPTLAGKTFGEAAMAAHEEAGACLSQSFDPLALSWLTFEALEDYLSGSTFFDIAYDMVGIDAARVARSHQALEARFRQWADLRKEAAANPPAPVPAGSYRVAVLQSILDLDELEQIFEWRCFESARPSNSEAFEADGTPTAAYTFYLKTRGQLEVATDKRYRIVDLTEAEIQWLYEEIDYWATWNVDPLVFDSFDMDRLRGLALRNKRDSFARAARKAGFTGTLKGKVG